MIEKNWRAIVLSLLAANLVFMALLELQRRTIWQGEREYFTRIEQIITTTDRTQAGYDELQKQLTAIQTQLVSLNERVNNVEIKSQELPASIAVTRDIAARVNALQIAVGRISAEKK
jgi:peptidoglycan hydrolase CwlO-like protein